MSQIIQQIAEELSIRSVQVSATITLLDEGATVPFISRYRKEVTGSLDDTQLRQLEERLGYLRDMNDRRLAILKNINEQGKLTDALKQKIESAKTKTELEDLYLPYKQKRRTKGQIAIESGLEPLADALFGDTQLVPETEAEKYVNAEKAVADTKAALDGARYILMERFAENAELLASLRQFLWQEGEIATQVIAGQESAGAKFSDYFEYNERIKKVPSHRALAVLRGRNEGVLQLSLKVAGEEAGAPSVCESIIADQFGIKDLKRPADAFLANVVRWTWKVKLLNHMESELLTQVRTQSETEAINVFARNLKDLLLAAPAGPKATLGLDPGLRTGVKIAVIDGTGKVMDHGAIFPNPPQNKTRESELVVAALCKKHNIELIAIGNGTASRETERFVAQVLKNHPELKAQKVIVSESGASVYSASEFAAREFPDLDVTIRGAVSIAKRLQDPLAELVKIDPKSIGVGQYQHDVSQTALARQLDTVVEDCVNSVGVDINTASAPLLSRVAGLSSTMADNIITWRNQNGFFESRKQLNDVPRIGPKAFEQAAGFLRINNGSNPLDASAVHPESYAIVDKISSITGKPVASLIGDVSTIRSIKTKDLVDDKFGELTVKDILTELEKPGRDPRPEFKTAVFQEGVEELKDLQVGMVLEGTITNVTNFGAFVDVGVHQDGLVHISALSHQFVDDPAKVVKAGDIVKVKVMDIDIARKRIALSMRLDDETSPTDSSKQETQRPRQQKQLNRNQDNSNNTMAALFNQAKTQNKKRL